MKYSAAIYHKNTGKIHIIFTTTIETDLEKQTVPADHVLWKGEANFSQYIDPITKEVVDKESLIAVWDKTTIVADGVDEAVLTGLPLNATVFIDDTTFVVSDGILNFTATSPGKYSFMIDEVQYLKKEWIVNAT